MIGQFFASDFPPNGAIVLWILNIVGISLGTKQTNLIESIKVFGTITFSRTWESKLMILTMLLATAFEQLIWTWCNEDTLISCGFTANGPIRGTKSKHNFLQIKRKRDFVIASLSKVNTWNFWSILDNSYIEWNSCIIIWSKGIARTIKGRSNSKYFRKDLSSRFYKCWQFVLFIWSKYSKQGIKPELFVDLGWLLSVEQQFFDSFMKIIYKIGVDHGYPCWENFLFHW